MTAGTPGRSAVDSGPRERSPLAHVPGLDGLRGIALLGVLLFHAGHLDGAFLSLDLFFVLSGFLITALLLREWDERGSIDLRRFWSRRARRLLPAVLVVVPAVSLYAAVQFDPVSLHRFRGDALSTLAQVANWREIATGTDYWKAYASPSPLRHAWSLSLEEQLYVLWPVGLLAGLRVGRYLRRGRRPVTAATAIAVIGSAFLLGHFAAAGDLTRAYYGTDTRSYAVLLGGLAALLLATHPRGPTGPSGRTLERLALPAAALLAVGWFVADGQATWSYRWGMPAATVLATLIVAAVGTGRPGPIQPFVELTPLQWLGRISYGVYLWHWPVFLVLDDPDSRPVLTVLRIGTSIALGVLSARLVEQPVRAGGLPTRTWVAVGGAGFVVAVGAVLLASRSAEAPPRAANGEVTSPFAGRPGTSVRLLVLGDSQAVRLAEVDPADIGPGVDLAHAALLGCGTGPGLALSGDHEFEADLVGIDCRTALERFRGAIAERAPDVVVLHTGGWEVLDHRVDGRDVRFGTVAWDEATIRHLRATLTELSVGPHRLVVLASPCFDPVGDSGGPPERGDDARVARWNRLLRSVGTELGVEVLPMDSLFCARADQPERSDGVHLTPQGALDVWAWLIPALDLEDAAAGRPEQGP